MDEFKEQTKFEWHKIDESKLGFNFGSLANKLFTEIGAYAESGLYTGLIYKYNIIMNLSSYVDDKMVTVGLNGSNAAMLSTVFDLYSEDDSIREYFNKTLTSGGWYVSNKYSNKVVFKKVLNDKLDIKFIPFTDDRRIPLYKVIFTKTDGVLQMILSKAEMRTLSKLLINFASNIALYVYMFQTSYKQSKLDRLIDKFDKMNCFLEKLIENKTIQESNYDKSIDWDNNSMVDVDNTNVKPIVNNVDIVHEDKTVNDDTSDDILNIDDLDDIITEAIDYSEVNKHIEEKSGIMVGKRDGYNVVSEFTLYPKEDDDMIEPIMEKSYIDNDELESTRQIYTNSKDVLVQFAKAYKVDRRKKYKSIVKSIEKTGIFSPESIPVMLVNRGMIGIPCTSLLYSISVFAATYEYSLKYPDKDFNELAISAYKALEMSAVDGHEMFSNDSEFKDLGNKYLETLIKTVGRDAKDIRTIDKYLVMEDDLYNFAILNVGSIKELNQDELNCLTAGITDVYMLLYYANTRYLSNRVMQEKNAGLVSIINKQMYTLARNILIEIINFLNDKTVYAEHVIRFEETVKFFSWDIEIYKEACIELFTYALYYKNHLMNKTEFNGTVKVGMPCLTY